MNRGKNVILIGFMGCGKTTVGLKLSYRLRMPVEDTDKLIERKEGRSISEIFEKEGEAAFRRMETALLEELRERSGARILSTGGGMPVNPANRSLLRQCGIVVYLKISPQLVYERLKGDKIRPLLQGEDPLSRIRGLDGGTKRILRGMRSYYNSGGRTGNGGNSGPDSAGAEGF